jgi:serine/threonine protein kinase/tetratricopeptide (TPR) repeat protein
MDIHADYAKLNMRVESRENDQGGGERMEDNLPKNIDGYPVLKELGIGASGIVYQVKLPGRQKFAALKLFTGTLSNADILRFRREFGAIARCRHNGIVAVYGLGEHDGNPYILMEFVKGKALDAALRNGLRAFEPLPANRQTDCAGVFVNILQILNYLHQQKIVHRDIKPANIVMTDTNQIKILDFGMAWNRTHSTDLKSGGTAGYQAPEIIYTRNPDPRMDFYSLGVTLYEILTGIHPFANYRDWQDLLNRQMNSDFTPLSAVNPAIDEHWQYFVSKLMAPDPSDRFYSAAQALAELGRMAPGELSVPISTADSEETWGILNTPWIGPESYIADALDALNDAQHVWFKAPQGSGRTRFLEEVTGSWAHNRCVLKINSRTDKPEHWIPRLFERAKIRKPSGKTEPSKDRKIVTDFIDGRELFSGERAQITEDTFSHIMARVLKQSAPGRSVLISVDDVEHSSQLALKIFTSIKNIDWIQLLIAGEALPENLQESCTIITWFPSDISQVKDLIQKMLSPSQAISDAVAESLHGLTQGRLGAVVQFFKIWLRSGHLKHSEGKWCLFPPASLKTAPLDRDESAEWIIRRPELRRDLPEKDRLEREVIRMISAYHKPVGFEVLSRLFAARDTHLLEILDKLMRSGWLTESVVNGETVYEFEQIQDKFSVYQTISPFHKRYLHRKIVETITKLPGIDSSDLSEHVCRSENPFENLQILEKAAQSARDRFNMSRALYCLDKMQEIITGTINDSAGILPGPVDWSYRLPEISNLTMIESAKNTRIFQFESLKIQVLEIWNTKGNIYGRTGDYGAAFDAYQHMLAGAQDSGNKKIESDALRLIGQILFYQRKLDESEKYFNESLNIRKSLNDRAGIADCLNALGVIAQQQQQNEKAHAFFMDSLEIRIKQNDEKGIAYVRNNLANLYHSRNDYANALSEFKSAADVSRKLKDDLGLAYSLYNIGGVYIETGRYREAIDVLEESLSIRRKMQDLQDIGHCLWQMATAFFKLEKYKEALECLDEAVVVLEEMGLSDDAHECRVMQDEIRVQSENFGKNSAQRR